MVLVRVITAAAVGVRLLCLVTEGAIAQTPFILWDPDQPLPSAAETRRLDGVRRSVVQRWDAPSDGYQWLHGAAIVWHQAALYASFGRNRGTENTVTEVASGRCSDDAGQTWGPLFAIDCGSDVEIEGEEAVGVFDSSPWAETTSVTARCNTSVSNTIRQSQIYSHRPNR